MGDEIAEWSASFTAGGEAAAAASTRVPAHVEEKRLTAPLLQVCFECFVCFPQILQPNFERPHIRALLFESLKVFPP
jgi:hypothetical protein